MKGLIFNILAEVVIGHHGEAAWDKVLEGAGVDGAYTAIGLYPDVEFERLVGSASGLLGKPVPEVLRWAGGEAFPLVHQLCASSVAGIMSARSLILALDDVIHPEVRRFHPGARCPHFGVSAEADGAVTLIYGSQRRLCRFAHGLIEGAARHFGQTADVTHARCMQDGDVACELRVGFS